MRWVLPVLVCGCNGIFGLDSTQLSDAPPDIVVDTPVPPACPAIGSGLVPQFTGDLFPIPAYGCLSYVKSSDPNNDVAMAWCNGQATRGPGDDVQTPVAVADKVYYPRLAPDGNHVFVVRVDESFTYPFTEYVWADGALINVGSYHPTSAGSVAPFFLLSPPTRGPDRHIVYVDYYMTPNELVEISDGTGTWTVVQRYPTTQLTTDRSVSEPSLSPDGLRLIFLAGGSSSTTDGGNTGSGGPPMQQFQTPVMYAERTTTSEPFGPARILQTVPDLVQWPTMSEDCSRIYFSALNRVFYLTQARR